MAIFKTNKPHTRFRFKQHSFSHTFFLSSLFSLYSFYTFFSYFEPLHLSFIFSFILNMFKAKNNVFPSSLSTRPRLCGSCNKNESTLICNNNQNNQNKESSLLCGEWCESCFNKQPFHQHNHGQYKHHIHVAESTYNVCCFFFLLYIHFIIFYYILFIILLFSFFLFKPNLDLFTMSECPQSMNE